MAAVTLETTELETLIEATMSKPSVGLEFLNKFRVENGKAALPNTSALVRPEAAAIAAALVGLAADLAA